MKSFIGIIWRRFWLGWLAVFTGTGLAATNTPALGPADFVWAPPGHFMLGSPPTEKDRESNEGPQTEVTLTQGFWISKNLVTQAQFQALMRTNPACFNSDLQRPVESVDWEMATNYCAHLTEQERKAGRLPAGYSYRLPTEAEWEYACRAGTTNRFGYGDDLDYSQLGKYAWFSGNSEGMSHPVGQKLPNPWGLFDLHGNVWEWCQDWYGTYPGGKVADPVGPSTGSMHVVRGGNWNLGCWACRSASRYGPRPGPWGCMMGFRPVLATCQP